MSGFKVHNDRLDLNAVEANRLYLHEGLIIYETSQDAAKNLVTPGAGSIAITDPGTGTPELIVIGSNGEAILLGGNIIEKPTENLGVGNNALANLTTGSFNTAVGVDAGQALTTGSFNTLLGANAGQTLQTGNSNVVIGENAQVAPAVDKSVVVGAGASSGKPNNIVIGWDASTGAEQDVIVLSSVFPAATPTTSNQLVLGLTSGGATAAASIASIQVAVLTGGVPTAYKIGLFSPV